jgi:hypothetical protein
LHVDDRESGAVALLMGQERDSLWSASFAARHSAGFEVDIACRLNSDRVVGSTYVVLTADDVGSVTVRGLDDSTSNRTIPGDGARRLHVDPRDVPASFPATVRWRYALEC